MMRFTPGQEAAMRAASAGSIDGRLRFPDMLNAMIRHDVERYSVDYCRGETTFYRPDGATLRIDGHRPSVPIATSFDAAAVGDAVRAAQSGADYRTFSDMAARAGCVGYHVSIPGRRVVYHGRTGEVQVEHFPD